MHFEQTALRGNASTNHEFKGPIRKSPIVKVEILKMVVFTPHCIYIIGINEYTYALSIKLAKHISTTANDAPSRF